MAPYTAQGMAKMFRSAGTQNNPPRWPVAVLLLLALVGCRDSEHQKASEEVIELRTRVAKLEGSLHATKVNLGDLREELTAAIEMRDELDLKVGKLTQERDEALELVKEAESSILTLTERLKQADAGKSQTQGQVGQLEQTIQQLQETIIEQQSAIAELEMTLQERDASADSQTEEIQELEVETDGENPNNIAP